MEHLLSGWFPGLPRQTTPPGVNNLCAVNAIQVNETLSMIKATCTSLTDNIYGCRLCGKVTAYPGPLPVVDVEPSGFSNVEVKIRIFYPYQTDLERWRNRIIGTP